MSEVFPVLTSTAGIPSDINRELVQVPEWHAAVWVYELSGSELDEYRNGMYTQKGTKLKMDLRNNTVRLVCLALRDANGHRLFPNIDQGIRELGAKGSGGTERVAEVARRLSHLAAEDEQELEENLDNGHTDSSPSGSQLSGVVQ